MEDHGRAMTDAFTIDVPVEYTGRASLILINAHAALRAPMLVITTISTHVVVLNDITHLRYRTFPSARIASILTLCSL